MRDEAATIFRMGRETSNGLERKEKTEDAGREREAERQREARQRAQKAKLQRMAGSHAVGTYSDSVTQAIRGRALRYSPGTRPFRYWLKRGWTQSSPASVM